MGVSLLLRAVKHHKINTCFETRTRHVSNGDEQRHGGIHRHNINLGGKGSVSSFILQDWFYCNKG